jgi:hypothetical protein
VVGAGLSLGVTAPLVAFAKSAVQAAGESEQAIAAVNASLASMGDAAGFSSKQLQDMAEQLQGKSLFEDDEILTKVTANMLTFGNVQGDVFDRAQKSALDLSARLGTDLQGSAIMVGKALNNPIAGLSALTKVGVSFSAQQKDQVKSMMSVGDIAGAQAIILGELERQYKGQADAARNTPYGQIQAAMMDIGNAAETVGAIILPVLADIAKQVSEAAEAFQTLDPEMQTLIVGGAAAAAAIGPLLVGLGLTVGAIGALSGGLVTVLSGVGALAVALSGPLLTGLGLAATAIGAMAGGVVTCLAGIGSLAVALSGALVTGLVAALSGIGAVAVALSGALATGLVAALSGIGAVDLQF